MNHKPKTGRRFHERVTLADVARHAGVSPMTVSRVVNDAPGVREHTRAAVEKAVAELGYTPNQAARSLASAGQIRIALLYENPSSTFLSAVLLGVLEQARSSDTQIVVLECPTVEDGLRSIDALIERNVDGILLAPPLADATALLDRLERSGLRGVTLCTEHPGRETSSVCVDDRAAARAMTRHLVSLGHRRIGYIAGSPQHVATGLRLEGYRDALAEADIAFDETLVARGRYTYRSGLEAAERLLSLSKRPTAIFASNDDMAAATVATAHRHHIDVPAELSVCGFDDTLLATTIWPELTTIRQPISEMSHDAIEMLERAIRRARAGEEAGPENHRARFSLVRRGSDAPPP